MNKLNKKNRDRPVDKQRDDSYGGGMLGDRAIEQIGKRAHEQQCGDCGGYGGIE